MIMEIDSPCSAPCEEFEGEYQFQIGFEPQNKTITKSVAWTFSERLSKLFVNVGRKCPIHFKTSTPPPPGTLLRCEAVYIEPDHRLDAVKCCPNHATLNPDDPFSIHFIRIVHPDFETDYTEEPVTGRLSAAVPYQQSHGGSPWVNNMLFQFMCRSSCMRRRRMQIVFKLEYGDQLLACQFLEVRVSACPGRDRLNEEEAAGPLSPDVERKRKNEKEQKFTSSKCSKSETIVLDSSPKQPKTDNRETYTIQVNDKEHYDILMRLKTALETEAAVKRGHLEALGQHKIPAPMQGPLQSAAQGSIQFEKAMQDQHQNSTTKFAVKVEIEK